MLERGGYEAGFAPRGSTVPTSGASGDLLPLGKLGGC